MKTKRGYVFFLIFAAAVTVVLLVALRNQMMPAVYSQGEWLDFENIQDFSVLNDVGTKDLKVIGYFKNDVIASYWLQEKANLQNVPSSDGFEELLVKLNCTDHSTTVIRQSTTSSVSSADPFLVDDQTLYSFPLQDDGCLSIIQTNLEKGTTETLIDGVPVSTPLVGFAKINQGTVAFLLTTDRELQQVLVWDKSARRLLEIYNTANLSLENPPQITAISSDGECLYYLIKEHDGKNTIQCNSLTGAVLWEQDLGLPEYEDPAFYADQLYIYDETFFVKWNYCGNLQYFTALKYDGRSFKRIGIPSSCPCYLLTSNLIEDEWLLFSTFPDTKGSADLARYNVKSGKWQEIHLDLEDSTNYQLFANEVGDIIAQIYQENGDITQLIRYQYLHS